MADQSGETSEETHLENALKKKRNQRSQSRRRVTLCIKPHLPSWSWKTSITKTHTQGWKNFKSKPLKLLDCTWKKPCQETCQRLCNMLQVTPATAHHSHSSLAPERIMPFSPPFSVTGVDLFGPFSLKYGRNKSIKAWGALFTCAPMLAIHLEIVESLSTESFLQALHRFVSHHGWPARIISDNGKSFIGAEKELRNLVVEGRKQIIDFAVLHKVRWIFTTPYSPHQGGIYESLIKQTKRAIWVAIGNQVLSWNEMSTVFAEVKSFINSRPLGYPSNDSNDLQPLTPNHPLLGRASSCVPQGPFKEGQNPPKRFEFVQSRPTVLETLHSRVGSHTYAKIKVAHQRSSDQSWRYRPSCWLQCPTRQVEPCLSEGRLSWRGWCDQKCSHQDQ